MKDKLDFFQNAFKAENMQIYKEKRSKMTKKNMLKVLGNKEFDKNQKKGAKVYIKSVKC